MKNPRVISLAVSLLVTMLACSSVTNFVETPSPAPAATALPSPSPTPTVILFADSEFVDSCSSDSTTDVKRFVENGQFHLRVLTPSFVAWTECTKDEYSDFALEVDATQVSGPDNNTYGVIFRYGLQANEFYAFLISGDGFYAFTVDGAEREEAEFLSEWAESSVIKQGAQTNHIKVIAVGSNMKYYVNDQFLGEVEDTRFSTGTAGFFAGTLENSGVQVSFDNLMISQP